MVKDIYKSEMTNKDFKDENCWRILPLCPKWHSDHALNVLLVPPMASESSSFIHYNESTPPRGMSIPKGRDKKKACNKGKSREESSEERGQRRDALLARGAL
ncbi:unnamed protein product [Linum trigynum]|uniref:Uncharacterized protein n=1 Tax=Linum trigynum TaxID=586398 RepID=A0AAV2F4P1_9ROSI